ncbi:restriction endonuclease [Akkermansia muciniphila]|jgi:hypothetical protein|uniref:Restriction endonuclease type IV Mrr domain-containing protein n=1 Tax=Akkermansia muciniphila TaxID=239935 RepID=A0AAP8T8K0_9BACT|nr:restriction endonuclease [Akkermansia muciniphila]PNC53852.1 hypothetical protein CXU09_11205 [Akkermansia muciniphila]QWO98920.1 restriction endonuclease [Akkermansia muciniphila]
MQRKLSPVLIELIQDACCKVFWYKKDLLRFLRLHKVPDNNFYLLESMTKAEFLGILFCDLNKNDCHHDLIYNIGVDIINMSSFPHLEKLENSELKIKDAQQSIKNLKPHIEKIKNIFSDEERKEARRLAEEKLRIERSLFLGKLNELSTELMSLSETQLGTQEGGYEFEKWLYNLFILFDLDTRKSYKESSGRQIDMAFSLDGQNYIVEAKFTKRQTSVSDVDIFNGKLKKLADGTRGFIISISGFEKTALISASSDRSWILMMDYTHIFSLILNDRISLPDVLKRIIRNASQVGNSYLPVSDF